MLRMVKASTAELAVRNYLTFLDDPARLVDRDRIEELERRVAASTDPIERLQLFSQIEQLLHPAEAPYRARFIENARAWADANGVTARAFLRMGVPRKVLDDAGLKISPSAAKSAAPGPGPRGRAHQRRSVRADEVVDVIGGLTGPFTLQAIESASGASPMTVRKALTGLIDTGQVRRIGPDPTWSSAGRAPVLYEHTGT